jgi:hypothetical protein
MPKQTYNKERQLIANQKWREKNPEHWAELCRNESKKYYEKNREAKTAKVLNNYYFKKELKTFLNILLD